MIGCMTWRMTLLLMDKNKSIEEMYQEIKDAEGAIQDAIRAKDAAKNKLRASLNQVNATFRDDKPKHKKQTIVYKKKLPAYQTVLLVLSVCVSIAALMFAVLNPIKPIDNINLPLLIVIILSVSLVCTVMFLTVAGVIVSLYLSSKSMTSSTSQFNPYQWMAEEQKNINLEDEKLPEGNFEESQRYADLIKKMYQPNSEDL
jgi:hypothetical protein